MSRRAQILIALGFLWVGLMTLGAIYLATEVRDLREKGERGELGRPGPPGPRGSRGLPGERGATRIVTRTVIRERTIIRMVRGARGSAGPAGRTVVGRTGTKGDKGEQGGIGPAGRDAPRSQDPSTPHESERPNVPRVEPRPPIRIGPDGAEVNVPVIGPIRLP